MASNQGGVLSGKAMYRGTLLQLQDKVKRDPQGYEDDFILQMRHFESKVKLFELKPTGPNKELCELVHFLGHVAPLYKEKGRPFSNALLEILEKHKEVLEPHVRRCMVQALCLLRNRQYLEPKEVLPLYFRLFKVQDRELRKLLLAHIVRDIKHMNQKRKNPQVNKQLQSYMYKVIQEDDAVAGRHALWVILDLYRRQIWTEDRIVNVISEACFSKHTKVMQMGLRFLTGQFPKDQEEHEDTDEEDAPEVKGGRTYSKKTKHRRTVKDRTKAKVSKMRKEKDAHVHQVFKPMEVLNDPQGFAERLLTQLQKTKERFNVRMLHMSVLSALINTHKLILLNFYPYIQRYMEPSQQHVTFIMAWASQAVHSLVPPESIHSLVMTIANHFVSDRASSDAITVGINTIREVCKRQPLVMSEDLLNDIAEYKRFKKDKGVVMASRGIIQLFRELQPEMLGRKDRGRNADKEKRIASFGAAEAVSDTIEGMDLLEEHYQRVAERRAEREENEGGSQHEGDQWSADTESEDESSGIDNGDGDWVSVSESDDGGDAGDDADAEGSDEEGSGGWEECSNDEEAEEGEDEDEDEEDEEFEVAEDRAPGVPSTREDLAERAESGKVNNSDLMATKILTPRDWQILERLKAQNAEEEATGGRKPAKKRRHEDIDDDVIGGAVTADMLEAYSHRKRRRDQEERRAHTEAVRGSFKAKVKLQKKGGGTTNTQKAKKKLTTMVARSKAVQDRKFETGKQKKSRQAVGKKRNLKFQYKRGGH